MVVYCHRCRRAFKAGAGLASHLRRRNLCAQVQDREKRAPSPDGAAYFTPPEALSPQANLLFYTAIQDNMSQHSDDDFSTLSEHEVVKQQIPADLMSADQNKPPRRDERQQKITNSVQDIINAQRPPPIRPTFIQKVLMAYLQIQTFLYNVLAHGCRGFAIYFLILAIMHCHGDKCTAYYNTFLADQERAKSVIFS